MKYTRISRLAAVLLALSLFLPTAAQALTIEEARALLTEHYIDTVPEDVLSQPTITDMLAALGDPYTVYYNSEEYAAFLASMEDSMVVGIGISSQVTPDGVLIAAVFADSPAEKGGLKSGDLITAVDGVALAGLDQGTVTGLLRGEEGSALRVSYLRNGQSSTVTLTRQEIVIPATTAELIDGHIGYIDCAAFGSETLAHFTEGLEKYSGEADRWILDLTGNGGGSALAAAQTVACFTGPSYTAFLQDGSGQISVYAPDNPALTLYPVIALTDSASASAAELCAAAVRDLGAGIVVGWRTYGKGTAQVLLDEDTNPEYFPDGDAMKVTAYRFYSASGNATDSIGVIPHLLIDPNLADGVARLLSAPNPSGDTKGLLRIDFVWRWYVDLDQALSEEFRPAFTALLEALPASVKIWEGTGGSDGWEQTSVPDLAEALGLEYKSRGFADTSDSPYAAQIDALATYFIVSGAGDGMFHPDRAMTRAELCALLAQALNCRMPDGESHFSDVTAGSWYGPAVNALADMGLVSGTGDGRFLPDAPVTHEQFFTIMGRLAQRLNMHLDSIQSLRPEHALEDAAFSSYSDWSRAELWLLTQSQTDVFGNTISLLWDDLSAIDPAAATTREEAACLVYQILSYVGILPV